MHAANPRCKEKRQKRRDDVTSMSGMAAQIAKEIPFL